MESSGHLYYIERQWFAFAKRSETFDVNKQKIIFIGDSIIDMFCIEDIFDGINFGISGEKISNAKKKINTLKNLDNKTIVLAYGINDIPRDTEAFIADYKTLINNLNFNGEIFIQSILPIEETIHKIYWGTVKTNEQIDVYNIALQRMCDEYDNCTFIDVRDNLSDETGQLRLDLQTGDGVHLNKNGYIILKENYNKFLI